MTLDSGLYRSMGEKELTSGISPPRKSSDISNSVGPTAVTANGVCLFLFPALRRRYLRRKAGGLSRSASSGDLSRQIGTGSLESGGRESGGEASLLGRILVILLIFPFESFNF